LAARALAGQAIAAVYSSSLIRARETAEIVAGPHALRVTTSDELVEVDVGRWEMRSWVDIAREEPEAYQRFQEDPGLHGYAGGENMREVQIRTTPALTALMSAHAGEQIVVVGHNVVNRAYSGRRARTAARPGSAVASRELLHQHRRAPRWQDQASDAECRRAFVRVRVDLALRVRNASSRGARCLQ
jgi:broad specificity phosphatase PhoE